MMSKDYRKFREIERMCGKLILGNRFHNSERDYVLDEKLTFLIEVSSEKDTYVEFDAELAIVLIQWTLFLPCPLYNSNPETVEIAASKTKRIANPKSD